MQVTKRTKIILSILLCFFLLIFSFFVYIFFSCKSWSQDLENTIPDGELVVQENIETEDLEKEIQQLNYSFEDHVALEITTKEFSSLLFSSLQDNEMLDTQAVYTKPVEKGFWKIYLKTKTPIFISLWLTLDVKKEDRQTAEIFVDDIYFWKYSLKSIGFDSVVSNVNQSLSTALITVEENGFSGRIFDNIELLETRMVVKLSNF